MKQENKNIRYFVAMQERDIDKWGRNINLMHIYEDETTKSVRWDFEIFPEKATAFETFEEAEHFAFALNFKNSQNAWETVRYFPIQIDMSYLNLYPIIEHNEEQEGE